MNETTPLQARLASALTFLIVLALLAAPACAPLCAGKICPSSMRSPGASQEPCHGMANMEANGGEQYVATSKTCGGAEFSAVLVSSDEQSLLRQVARDDSSPVLMSNSSELGLERLDASPGRWGVYRIPLESKVSVLLNTILRI